MAIVTYPLAGFAEGAVRFELDYDDAVDPLRVALLRCINGTQVNAWAEATVISDPARTTSREFGPGTTAQNAPQGPLTRFDIVLTLVGGKLRISNLRLAFRWPA
jgi:hypothetical protein